MDLGGSNPPQARQITNQDSNHRRTPQQWPSAVDDVKRMPNDQIGDFRARPQADPLGAEIEVS
jgi:hypothetical protein